MKYLLFLIFAVSAVEAKTYDFSRRLGIGGSGGYTFPTNGNRFDDFADGDVTWGGHARYQLTPASGLQLNYSRYDFKDTDIAAGVMDLMYLYRINEGDRITPVLGLAAGVADMDNISPFHDGAKFASRVRAGFEFAVTDDLLASVYADYQYIGKMPGNSGSRDGLPGQEIFAIVPQIGLTYFFGPGKEMKEDKKPQVTEPAPVAAAALIPDADKDGIPDSSDRCPNTRSGAVVNSYGCMSDEKVSMSLEVLFPSGQSELNSEANPHLDELATFMNEHPNTKLEVQGHTDNTGTHLKNKKLSEKRANAVRTYLIEEAGIQPSRISAYGYGDTKPIRENSTPEGREENRRVIGVITQ